MYKHHEKIKDNHVNEKEKVSKIRPTDIFEV